MRLSANVSVSARNFWIRALIRMRSFAEEHRTALRIALYFYIVLVACPIRYWPLEDGVDATWRFALNYAHAQGLTTGIDTVFTSGPLGYLMFPQHNGANLVHGLQFQALLWIVLAAVLADLFFRSGFPLRNLAFFSFWFCLAGPLFWFDFLGQENLMLAAALILIVMFHFQGSWLRYVAALALIGVLPLFKLTAGMLGAAAVTGFLVDRIIRLRAKAIPAVALAILIPVAVAGTSYSLVLPSVPAFRTYLRGAVEIVNGFSSGMSATGSTVDFALVLEAIAVLTFLLLRPSQGTETIRFFSFLFALPLFVSFKHGLVRHDQHIVSFIGFLALALALVSLTTKLKGTAVKQCAIVMALFLLMWQDSAWRHMGRYAIVQATGAESAEMVLGVLSFGGLGERLDRSIPTIPEDSRLEPEIAGIVGNSPVGPLSFQFVYLAAARLNLALPPVVQTYSAYTPYLDGLDAAWVRDKGPRYLIFDGKALDDRDAWAQTPATWLEVYKWYDTRLLGPRNLLLERRSAPRFTTLETISRFQQKFPGEFRLPVSSEPIFWTMRCNYSLKGTLEKTVFGVPEVVMAVHQTDDVVRSGRVLPEVLVSPVIGNYLPGNLAQFGALFGLAAGPGYAVDSLRFEGPGVTAFKSSCEVELLRPVSKAITKPSP